MFKVYRVILSFIDRNGVTLDMGVGLLDYKTTTIWMTLLDT